MPVIEVMAEDHKLPLSIDRFEDLPGGSEKEEATASENFKVRLDSMEGGRSGG